MRRVSQSQAARRIFVFISSFSSLGALATGCFAVADLDRFHVADGGAGGLDGPPMTDAGVCGRNTDFSLHVRDMIPHVGERFEAQLVVTGSLRAKAVIDPLPGPDADLRMPLALEMGTPHDLEMWADHAVPHDGVFMGPPGGANDHSWVISPLPTPDFTFVHNTTFTALSGATQPGLDFTLTLIGFQSFHAGRLFEVHVVERSTCRTVGLYRTPVPDAESFSVTIPAIIEAGTVYQVDFYVDANGNGTYDPPSTDHAWRLVDQEAMTTGLAIDFPHDTNFTDVRF